MPNNRGDILLKAMVTKSAGKTTTSGYVTHKTYFFGSKHQLAAAYSSGNSSMYPKGTPADQSKQSYATTRHSSGRKNRSDEAQAVKKAKRLFFVGLIDISWRLAAAIIIPVVGGYWLDNKTGSGSLFTLIGLFSGTILAGFIIYKTSKKLSKEIDEL